MNYLKISKATDLKGGERKIYRGLEILPGFLSWTTLLVLLIFSYFQPVWVAYFILAFDVYWILLVFFLGIYLFAAYRQMKKNLKVDWLEKCNSLGPRQIFSPGEKKEITMTWSDITHLVIFPIYQESMEVIHPTLSAIACGRYPTDKIIMVLTVEERGGEDVLARAKLIEKEFGSRFLKFIVMVHPDGIVGEIKGKGANQTWAARRVKESVIDREGFNYDKILTSVFDIDTVIYPDYFFCLTYKFLTVVDPYRASYQPIPVYHNNVWQAPFFARTAASSNTFWQMMQQVRQEKLATYSSHSLTWRSLIDIDFWSTNMVSEDSRIFWHCFLFYKGHYRVEPLYYPVSMDVCMDDNFLKTAKNLYKQQLRWGWGVENIPYLIFNFLRKRREISWRKGIGRILVQLHGFHSWATNALIIAILGWMPLLLGGDRFNETVLSNNLPIVTRWLMTIAMGGLVFSAIISTLLLPKRPKKYGFGKNMAMLAQWILLPFSIIIFGAIPGLEAQTRLMFGKYMGFWVTPKSR